MFIVKKSTLKNGMFFIASLALLVALVALFAPNAVSFAEDATCGDEICDPTENNDLCPQDCHCTDNGVVEAAEGCGCKDVICDGESIADMCGVPAQDGECPEGLKEHGGICWDACECQGICTEDDEKKAANACATFLTCDDELHNCTSFCCVDEVAELERLWPCFFYNTSCLGYTCMPQD